MSDVLFARQPILDAEGALVAYDLLPGPGDDRTGATSRVLSEVGLARAAGGAPALLHLAPGALLAMDPLPFGPEGVLLTVPAGHPHPDLPGRLARLREHGYRIALDDWTPDSGLTELASVVRLDARTAARPPAGLRAVAVGVDDHDVLGRCREAGFTLFQGDVVSRPRAVFGQRPPATSLAAVRCAAGLAGGEEGIDGLQRAISADPGLTVRLLRWLNSASFSLRCDIHSVRHAICLLGERTVRQWALLMVVAGVGQGRAPLVTIGLSRAHTCASIAATLGADDADTHFSCGLLSVVDALLDQSMADALDGLPLAPDMRAALLEGTGGKGRVLGLARACERGDWEAGAAVGIEPGHLAELHAEALAVADETLRGL